MIDIKEIEDYVSNHIDDAIHNEWIEVYFQPVIRTLTGNLCGSESLARWNDPHYGLLAPFHFIPVLEETGDIYKLDLYVIKKACQYLHAALVTQHNAFPLSVNLSRRDFIHEDLVETINAITKKYEIPHELINIEITESIFVEDLGMIKHFMDAFHQSGYQVWIDDFGSGYSSLGVLKDFDFDELKIDMSFLRNFNEKSKRIIESVVRMAKMIGIQTLAEGVESKEQFDFLKAIGCEKIQGFYFGKPMPHDVFMAHCQKRNISFEDIHARQFYDAIGSINYQTHSPLLICTLINKHFQFLYVNKAYKQVLKRDDIEDITQWENTLNDQVNPMHQFHLKAANKAYSRQMPTIITYPRSDHYMELTVEPIANYNDIIALKAELHYIDIHHSVENEFNIEDEYVRDIFYACYDLAVMDLSNDAIRELKSGNSSQPIAREHISHGIREIFKEYTDQFIYKADQEDFYQFYNFDTLQSRMKKAPEAIISGYFRAKNDDGQYIWLHQMFIAIPKTHFQKILIVAMDSEMDQNKLLKLLHRDHLSL